MFLVDAQNYGIEVIIGDKIEIMRNRHYESYTNTKTFKLWPKTIMMTSKVDESQNYEMKKSKFWQLWLPETKLIKSKKLWDK